MPRTLARWIEVLDESKTVGSGASKSFRAGARRIQRWQHVPGVGDLACEESRRRGRLVNRHGTATDGPDAPRYDISVFDGKFSLLNRRWDGDMTAGVDAKGLTYTTPVLKSAVQVTGHPVCISLFPAPRPTLISSRGWRTWTNRASPLMSRMEN